MMKKKDFRTRMVKVLGCDPNFVFRGRIKIVLNEYEAIEITEEEFEKLRIRKDPFAEYNSPKKQYNAFVIPDKYGSDDEYESYDMIYILNHICDNYHGFRRHCNLCKSKFDKCIIWDCYCGESESGRYIIAKTNLSCNDDDYRYRDIYQIPTDDTANYYMYDQLEEQNGASDDEFIPIKSN